MAIKSKKSELINQALLIATRSGNKATTLETDWSEMDEVISMSLPLNPTVKKEIDKIKGLEYREFRDGVHYPSDDSYVDLKSLVCLSFPVEENNETENAKETNDPLIAMLRAQMWKFPGSEGGT